jgi:superfamily I DNA/RNA helicase
MTTENKPVLNAGQQAAADGFFNFLLSNENNELIISGPGGVGKTFLMGHMIDEIMPKYFKMCELMGIAPEYASVIMAATTNKAADVLTTSTKHKADTIHSFLALKVKDDFTTGRSSLTKTTAWTVHQKKIIFIDECSMIDTDLRNIILEGTHNSKIIYVGDHCQLAPIMEPISPIYRDNLPFFALTESVRNAGQPALMHVCQQLRDTVETGVFNPIQAVPGVIDWLSDEDAENEIHAHFSKQTTTSRILAYSNARVLEFNSHIRDIRNLPEEFTVGELLVNNSAIRIGKSMLSVDQEVEIIRQDYKPTKVEISDNVYLDILRTDLQTSTGIVRDVNVPVDQKHYTDLIRYYQKLKNWNRYFHLKNNYPDLRQRDASTVHKSQGSSYDTVFIDLANLSACHQPNVAARLLYVAFSRARNRIVLFGNLTSKYGGVVR